MICSFMLQELTSFSCFTNSCPSYAQTVEEAMEERPVVGMASLMIRCEQIEVMQGLGYGGVLPVRGGGGHHVLNTLCVVRKSFKQLLCVPALR